MKININEIVRIKLTDSGVKHYRKYYSELLSYSDIPINIPNNPVNNILETELWSVMQVFGNGIYMGMLDPFFENNEIEIIQKEKSKETQFAIDTLKTIIQEIDNGDYAPEHLEPELSKLLKLFEKK